MKKNNDPFGIGTLMKGLTNEHARAHGAAIPFPEVARDPKITHDLDQAQAEVATWEDRGGSPKCLDKC